MAQKSVAVETILILTISESQVRGDALADELNREFAAAVERSGSTRVVVDLKSVEYFSSVGFRPLLMLHRKVKENGGRVALCNLSQVVNEMLHVVKFIDTAGSHPAPFEVQKDRKAAVLSLLDLA
jgi:anti-anti-sigma factor